ncbi:MAG: hypothetical protein ACM3X1_04820 [Ignavibacteriales bacterium]
MGIKYAMEFTQTYNRELGLIESRVYLNVLQLTPSGRYNVVKKLDLGRADSEEEANQITDRYLYNISK